MLFKDQIDFVLQHLKKNKMRVFTTILATTMGCAFLIVLASVAFGLQGSLRDEILMNDGLTKIEVQDAKINEKKIKDIPNVQTVFQTTNFSIQSSISIGEYSSSPSIVSSDFQGMEKAKIKLAQGEYNLNENSIIVGYHVARNLLTKAEAEKIEKAEGTEVKTVGLKDTILGKKITIEWIDPNDEKTTIKKEFTVTGIAKKPKNEFEEDNNITMNKSGGIALRNEMKKKFNDKLKPSEMIYTTTLVYATDLEAVKEVNKTLKDMGYYTSTISEQLDQLNSFFTALKIGLIFVGTIAVLIASIGIFNTMTMAVNERTREIGVMKAIGASPKLIQRLFIMESAYIGIIGTLIAIISSYIISFVANFTIPIILDAVQEDSSLGASEIVFSAIPWQLVLVASAISIGVAIISGWRPARKATKIDVLEALRRD